MQTATYRPGVTPRGELARETGVLGSSLRKRAPGDSFPARSLHPFSLSRIVR
jgi:hypothetical protein